MSSYPRPLGLPLPSSLVPLPPPPTRTSPESVSGWRKQQRAETDAGFVPTSLKILLPLFRCDLCTICIGPDYYEQELFLYPVHRQAVCCGDTLEYFHDLTWLHICGGCARSERHHLEAFYQMVKPEYWLTTELLATEAEPYVTYADPCNAEQKQAISQHIDAQLLACYRFHLFVYCIEQHIPLHTVFVYPQPVAPYLTLLPHMDATTADSKDVKRERERRKRSRPEQHRQGHFLPLPRRAIVSAHQEEEQACEGNGDGHHEEDELLTLRFQKNYASLLFG